MTTTRFGPPQLRAASTDQSESITPNDLTESCFNRNYFRSDSRVWEDVAQIPFVSQVPSIDLLRTIARNRFPQKSI